MGRAKKISRKQLMTIQFLMMLSVIIRLLPEKTAKIAGNAAWLAPIIALPAMLLLSFLLCTLMKDYSEDEGLANVILKLFGKKFGRFILLTYAVWILFFVSFALRTGDERLLITVYEKGSLPFFLISMLAAVTAAALGNLRTLARSAGMILPIMVTALLVLLVSAIWSIKKENLLPVSILNLPSSAKASLYVINSSSIWVYSLFSEDRTEQKLSFAPMFKLMGAISFFALLISVAVIGFFGGRYTAAIQSPFFIMVKNIRIFDVVERVEALTIAIWVLTDFVSLSFLLMISVKLLCIIFGFKDRKKVTAVCSTLVLALAFLIAENAFYLRFVSENIVTLTNAVLIFAGIPTFLAVSKIKSKKDEKKC